MEEEDSGATMRSVYQKIFLLTPIVGLVLGSLATILLILYTQPDSVSRVLDRGALTAQTGPRQSPWKIIGHKSRIVLIAGWSYGSSFTQNIITSHPGVLKIYEPFQLSQNLYLHRLRNWNEEPNSRDYIMDLLSCRFDGPSTSNLSSKSLIFESSDVMDECKHSREGRQLCYHPKYLKELCEKFPISLIKFVRLSLHLMDSFMLEPSLPDLQIIYLSRDPRAIMNSRLNNYPSTTWCDKKRYEPTECPSATIVCDDLDKDLTAAIKLKEKYPKRVHIVRYEDMALNPADTSKRLLDALGIDYRDEISEFLNQHTKVDIPQSKLFRKSKDRATGWIKELSISQLIEVESVCSNVMERYGYIPIIIKLPLHDLTVNKIIRPLPGAI